MVFGAGGQRPNALCRLLVYSFLHCLMMTKLPVMCKIFGTAQDVSRELLYSAEAQLSDQLT